MSNEFPLRRNIYWADLKPATGSEQDGFRPVLVVSNNIMNERNPNVMIVPMSRAEEKVTAGIFNIQFAKTDYLVDTKSIDE
jgi:mRNA interferase MazF